MGYLFNTQDNIETEFESMISLRGDGRNNGSLIFNRLSVKDSAVYFCAAYYTLLESGSFNVQKPSTISEHTQTRTPAPVG